MKKCRFIKCRFITSGIVALVVSLALCGCRQEPVVEPESQLVSVPVAITYNSDEMTVETRAWAVAPGSTVLSGTELTVTPASGGEKEPVLFLTANGLPVAYSGNAATITVGAGSSSLELKVASRQALDAEPEQYKVRLLFAGEKQIPVSTSEKHDFYTMLKGWFDAGASDRKADFQLVDTGSAGGYQDDDVDYKMFAGDAYKKTFAQAPHAAVLVLGYKELAAEAFDEESFAAWYGGMLSGYRRVRKGAAVVAVSLPPVAVFSGVAESRWKAVDGAIRAAARAAGAALVDLSALYKKYPAMSADTTLAKRHITEEIFLAFYSRIEAQAGNPEDMMIDGKPITTTPRQKWSRTDDGNQDTAKRELIQTIASGDKTKWPQVVFIGDSITDFYDGTYDNKGAAGATLMMTDWWNENVGWSNNKALDESGSAATYRALNLGNSGDFTQSLLYRLQKIPGDDGSGAYTGAFQFKDTVKAVVLMIGTNNIGVSSPSSTDVGNTRYQERPISTVEAVKGIQAVIGVLKKGFPNAKIILMGVLPRGTGMQRNNTDFIRLQVLSTNRQLYDLYGSGQDSRVQLLDLYENFVDSAGVQKSGSLEALGDVGTCDKLFFDTVHPNNAGYKVWWDNLKPILDVILQ